MRLVRDDLHGAEPGQQRVEGDLALHPGVRRTDAVVDASPEAQGRVVLTAELEVVSPLETRRVVEENEVEPL